MASLSTLVSFLSLGVSGGSYGDISYWDERYNSSASPHYQWIFDETEIAAFLKAWTAGFGVRDSFRRVAEVGFGASTVGHNVLYGQRKGHNPLDGSPTHLELLQHLHGLWNDAKEDRPLLRAKGLLTTPSESGSIDVNWGAEERTYVGADASSVATRKMRELVGDDPVGHQGLSYLTADAYEFLDGLTTPVDLLFDSSVFDTLRIANWSRTMREFLPKAQGALHPEHGVWLSASFYNYSKVVPLLTWTGPEASSSPFEAVVVCQCSETGAATREKFSSSAADDSTEEAQEEEDHSTLDLGHCAGRPYWTLLAAIRHGARIYRDVAAAKSFPSLDAFLRSRRWGPLSCWEAGSAKTAPREEL